MRYKYVDEDYVGLHLLLWPTISEFIKDGTTYIICQEPFRPKGGWNFGMCKHVYHPRCLILPMVMRKQCAQCKALFYLRLYKTFGLEDYMPEHFEFDEENLMGTMNRGHWGKDMLWMWK